MPKYPKITKSKIKYQNAPSGYINIGKWTPPFEEVKKGHGFMGIIAEDSKSGELQCHICGRWLQQLPIHLKIKHKISGNQYRKKFDLLQGTALKSKRIRLIHSKVCQKAQKERKMNLGTREGYGFQKANQYAGNRKGKPKAKESQNKYGVCDLQIMTKIITLSKKLNKTPTLTEIKKEYGGTLLSIMHERYGSYIKYCKKYLKMQPNFSSHNPKNKKAWKKELIEIGIEKYSHLKKGETLTTSKMPKKELRYIYKYFKGFKDYKKQLQKFIKTN